MNDQPSNSPVQDPTQVQATPADARNEELQRRLDEQEKQADEQQLAQELLQAQQAELKENNITDPLGIFVTDVERELLFHVLMNMKHRELSLEQSQQLAKDFLACLPVQDKEELLKKLQTLGQKYHEAQTVYVKYAATHEEEKKNRLITQMSEHIQSGNIEEAIAIAKGGTSVS